MAGQVDDNKVRLRHEGSGKADVVKVTNVKVHIANKFRRLDQQCGYTAVLRLTGFSDLPKGFDHRLGITTADTQLIKLCLVRFTCGVGGKRNVVADTQLDVEVGASKLAHRPKVLTNCFVRSRGF